MTKKLLLFVFCLLSLVSFSQEIEYKEYSYSEFFKMIEQEKDTVFELDDAIIRFDIKTDSIYGGSMNFISGDIDYYRKDTLKINKKLVFKNVQFLPFQLIKKGDNEFPEAYGSGLLNFIFKKEVSFENCLAITIYNAVFEDYVSFTKTEKVQSIYNYFTNFLSLKNEGLIDHASFSDILIKKVNFKNGVNLNYNIYEIQKELRDVNLKIENCIFNLGIQNDLKYSQIFLRNLGHVEIINSKYNIPNSEIIAYTNSGFILKNNSFSKRVSISFGTRDANKRLNITENTFFNDVHLSVNELYPSMDINWEQWQNRIISSDSYYDFRDEFMSQEKYKNIDLLKLNSIFSSDSVYTIFKKDYFLKNKNSLKEEFKLRSKFVQFYRDQFELDDANMVYLEYKDIETIKSKIKYEKNPSFDTFFTWKINQFLNVFSAYGTKPSKAIIFSLYVILLFALVYLLFPNSWDTLGNKRLMYRFEFFAKYLSRNEGMHTLYLEEKQKEISTYEDFKNNLEKAQLELPSFFISWSKPLYNASLFSTKMMSTFLKLTDVLQGKWIDLTPTQKRWKSLQIGLLLIIGLFYDLFIKVLNALMLSINTFTTLGFGEIPIKGLPRYLAIIQGFIGWFMLTIFSVSLISQLLN